MRTRLLSAAIIVTFVTTPLGLLLLFLTPAPARADCGADASSCKVCHEGEQQMPVNAVGAWHTDHAFGDFCASCHLGDKGTADQAASHQGMRPSVMADPRASCEACHAGDYQQLAARYEQGQEESKAAAPAAVRQLPPPGSNNRLFVGINLATFLGLLLLFWAWEKGPLARFTVRRLPPISGGQAATAADLRPCALSNPFALRAWSPYVAGAGLGLVGIGALWLSEQPLGSSGAFMIGASSLLKLLGLPLSWHPTGRLPLRLVRP